MVTRSVGCMFPFPGHFQPVRAGLAGALASAAYALEMYADMAVTGSRFDDIQLIEGAIRGRKARIPALGMAIHLVNGAALGEVYAAFAEPYLPGPAWLKGLVFGQLFLLAVWPSVPLVDAYHPLVKAGAMPKLGRPLPFAQNMARHVVFGLVLAISYRFL